MFVLYFPLVEERCLLHMYNSFLVGGVSFSYARFLESASSWIPKWEVHCRAVGASEVIADGHTAYVEGLPIGRVSLDVVQAPLQDNNTHTGARAQAPFRVCCICLPTPLLLLTTAVVRGALVSPRGRLERRPEEKEAYQCPRTWQA